MSKSIGSEEDGSQAHGDLDGPEGSVLRKIDRWNITGRLSAIVAPINAAGYAAAVTSAVARGHGVLAEKANHMIDLACGSSAIHVGADNARNGADRIVDGILIQTKYCSSGSKCISSCFKGGSYRYMSDGMPMQVEVPRDLHHSAVQAMEVRIRRGEVPGVTNPADAEGLVRSGHLTYEQAVNLGRAGTVESIAYDAVTGSVVAGCAFGLSAAARFAQGVWHGEDAATASIAAIEAGVAIGGLTLVTSIVGNQLARTAFDHAMRPVSHLIVDGMSSHTIRELAAAFGREGISGAAAQSFVAKALRGNLVGLAATNGVMAGVDLWRYATGRMTAAEAGRSTAVRAGGAAAGSAGWMIGAAKGAALGSIVPGIGTGVGAAVGGLTVGLIAGTCGNRIASGTVDLLTMSAEDKASAYFIRACELEIEAHMMSQKEDLRLRITMERMGLKDLTPLIVRARDPGGSARAVIAPEAMKISRDRARISLPSNLLTAE